MNLTEFIQRYKAPITRQVIHTYPPVYKPAEAPPLPPLKRRPLGGQIHAIKGAALSLENNQGTTIVGEMGTGKTLIGIASAHAAGFQRILVLCPPHLVAKWKREVEMTIAGAQAAIVKSITDLEKLRHRMSLAPFFVILSREKAKLGFRWKPAFLDRINYRNGKAEYDEDNDRYHRANCCMECHAVLTDDEGVPLSEKQLKKKKTVCQACLAPAWTADRKGPKRYPLADYIKNRMRDVFDLLIADEVHEFKGRGSAQGIAAGVLADVCKKTLTLTGTLTGGYSSTLFHLLFRFSPEIRQDFAHTDESKWIARYGFLQHTTKHGDDEAEDGRASRRKNYRKQTKELPGLAPAALFHLIPNTVFIRLHDVASDLPEYQEQLHLSSMEKAEGTTPSQDRYYHILAQQVELAMKAALAAGSQRLLATYLQTLLAYPDAVTKGETVVDPRTGELIAEMPPLPEDKRYPKEQALVDLIGRERMAGRHVLVYVTHTGKRDITPRLTKVLRENNINAKVLKADTVPPDKREEWVAHRVAEGADALICHPKLVQTGLDLIDFPTIVWYEVDYSVYTMRQASRRSWRIGQKRPVNVLYMAYRNTLQAEALRLVARKMQSSLAVEGELPEDGLAAYGDDGQDMMMTLAKSILSGHEPDDTAIESIFAQAKKDQELGEAFLVEDDWHTAPEPEQVHVRGPEPAPLTDRDQQTLFSWAEFLHGLPEPAPKRRRQQAPPSPSLFDWALANEEQQTQLAAV